MSEPLTPLPEAKAFGEDERAVLLGYLDYHRAVLGRKAEGVSEEQARTAACPPSRMTLLGLIRHMTDVERWWFRRWLLDEAVDPIFADDEEGELPTDTTIADALAAYWHEIQVVNGILLDTDLDTVGAHAENEHGGRLRRVVVHMIEEYARHCGHADLLREALDGTTGD